MPELPAPRLLVAGTLLAVAALLGGCGGSEEKASSSSLDDPVMAAATGVVNDAVQSFREDHDAYPLRVRQSGDRVELRRGTQGSDVVVAGVWDSVDLAWYADRADEREVSIAGDPGRGNSFSFCLERGDRHATTTGGRDGVAYTRSLTGGCPTRP